MTNYLGIYWNWFRKQILFKSSCRVHHALRRRARSADKTEGGLLLHRQSIIRSIHSCSPRTATPFEERKTALHSTSYKWVEPGRIDTHCEQLTESTSNIAPLGMRNFRWPHRSLWSRAHRLKSSQQVSVYRYSSCAPSAAPTFAPVK